MRFALIRERNSLLLNKFICFYILSFISYSSLYGQRVLSVIEILENWKSVQTEESRDSLYRTPYEIRTRQTFDSLMESGVDTILVYSRRTPGPAYIRQNDIPCDDPYPATSYISWKENGIHYTSKLTGKCETVSVTDGQLVEFMVNNFQNMRDEFFMNAIYSAETHGERIRIRSTSSPHDTQYTLLLNIGENYKYLFFDNNAITDQQSLFYDYNLSLISYRLFKLIENKN